MPRVTTPTHRLRRALLYKPIEIAVVGCGGTGSAVLCGLPALHQALVALGHPHGLAVCAIDGDRVSESNCARQPFARSEIGMYKVQALMNRINAFWGLTWGCRPAMVRSGADLPNCDFLISCVDTRQGRATLAKIVRQKTRRFAYWLDTGNTATTGQYVLGEPLRKERKDRPARLPCVDELFPEIIAPGPEEETLPSCSAREALIRQEPFINQILANQVLGMLGVLFRQGELDHHGGFVNLQSGRVSPLPVDPAAWSRLKAQTTHAQAA